MSDDTIVVRRFRERGVNKTPQYTCTTYGDSEEIFLFKQERLVYLNQLFLFLLRHNKLVQAVVSVKKKSNGYRTYFYKVPSTHVVGGDHDHRFPVEVFTGDKGQVNERQLWEPATYSNATTVVLTADGME